MPLKILAVHYIPDERLLRKIICEELAAQLSPLANPDQETDQSPDSVMEAEQQFLRNRVEKEIVYYIGPGWRKIS